MKITLRIVPTNQTHAAQAWLVTGTTVQGWLAEICQWEIPLELIVLRPLSNNVVLVTWDQLSKESGRGILGPKGIAFSATSGSSCSNSLRSNSVSSSPPIPYRVIQSRLFLPSNAELFPAISDEELASLLPAESTAELIWHPAFGLTRFDAADRLRVVDLLQLPTPSNSHWGRAVSGTAFRSRLISVEPRVIPTVVEMMQLAGREIGSNSIDELPPSPDEGVLGKLDQLMKPLRNAWKNLTKRPSSPPQTPEQGQPGSKTGPAGGILQTALGGLLAPVAMMGSFLGKMIPKSIVDQAARNREIDRLMNLLKNDPDAGLKFALPMGGSSTPRGIAPATNQLSGRNVDFGLENLFASRPADEWDILPSQQTQLVQMYRSLAEREIRLGRHRRAAYIYAELLGEIQSAATALETGRHYREAAALYRERLNRPADAARCLERGGLLDEAAVLYLQLKMYEQTAELYQRLERPDEAERIIRIWASDLQKQWNFLQASEILHQKLRDIDGALAILNVGCLTDLSVSAACHQAYFALLGQTGRHEAASQRIAGFRTQTLSKIRTDMVARVLSNVATRYEDATVRASAFDTTQLLVSRILPESTPAEASSLLGVIRSLVPEDRLLNRDCDRFLRINEAVKQKQQKVRKQSPGLDLVREFELQNKSVSWTSAVAAGEALFAAGLNSDSDVILQRVPWANVDFQVISSTWQKDDAPIRRIMLDVLDFSTKILIHPSGNRCLATSEWKIIRADPANTHQEYAGSPIWANESTLAFSRVSGRAVTWCVRATQSGQVELMGYSPDGSIISNLATPFEFGADNSDIHEFPFSIVAKGWQTRIASGQFIFRPPLGDTRPWDAVENVTRLDEIINSLHWSQKEGLDCLVALTQTGGVMLAEPIQNCHPVPFAEEMVSPVGTFLQSGIFAVADKRECRAFIFENGIVKQLRESPLASPAIAVTRTSKLGEFAVLCDDGVVRIFGIRL